MEPDKRKTDAAQTQTVLKHISGCPQPCCSSAIFGLTNLQRLLNQILLIAHLRGGPGAGKWYKSCFHRLHGCFCISKTYWEKQDLWFLPAESNCNLIVPWTWGQIAIYCEPQTHCKKLNPFGGYECKYMSLLEIRLTDSRNCFLLYILGEQPTLSLKNTQREVKNTLPFPSVTARQGRGEAGWVQLWQNPREDVQSHLFDYIMSLPALCH